MPETVKCPQCRAATTVKKAASPKAPFTCKECGFTASMAEALAVASKKESKAATPPKKPRRPGPVEAPPSSGGLKLLPLIIGGIVLGVGGAYFVSSKPPAAQPPAPPVKDVAKVDTHVPVAAPEPPAVAQDPPPPSPPPPPPPPPPPAPPPPPREEPLGEGALVYVVKKDGTVIEGEITSRTEAFIEIVQADGTLVRVLKSQIDVVKRQKPQTPPPPTEPTAQPPPSPPPEMPATPETPPPKEPGSPANDAKPAADALQAPKNMKFARSVTLPNGATIQVYSLTLPDNAGEIDMVHVPAGDFLMGSNSAAAANNERPQHTHPMARGFWVGRTDITWKQFKAWCKAKGREVPKAPTWGIRDNDPVVNVTWDQAVQFCRWATGRLPTEAEWEKAARGTDGRVFPWGDSQPEDDLAAWKGSSRFHETTAAVGMFPKGASPYGLLDMSGNVWQWTNDSYDKEIYAQYSEGHFDAPPSAKAKTLRGGGFCYDARLCRTTARSHLEHDKSQWDAGFRLVVDEGTGAK
ncbi:MAG TPA: SUMF1/EgtB/PvdO family nonheme iron enzyme [Planctomycetota bacterium]|nr:SUMF1/EgtB/PvdO family nonheme iron enzyme [Planctomycetota bacterium]